MVWRAFPAGGAAGATGATANTGATADATEWLVRTGHTPGSRNGYAWLDVRG